MYRKLTAFAALLALAAIPARADLVIDDFGTSAQAASATGLGSATSTTAADVLGGFRTLNLTVDENPLNRTALASVDPSTGYFILETGAAVSASGSIVYDADGAGLGGLDLAGYGSQFTFDVVFGDPGLSLGITVVDTFGATATVSTTTVGLGLINFAFGDFTGVDLSSVASLAVIYTAPEGADFALNFVGVTGDVPPVVPEPASAALLCLGAVGSAAAFRRRRKARG